MSHEQTHTPTRFFSLTLRLSDARLPLWGPSALLFAATMILYARTAAPTVYGLDSAGFTNAAYLLGLVHPPGYPIYILIGHLFTLLPVGDVGYRMNLMSGFFGALTVVVLFHLLLKLTRNAVVSFVSALWLAYSFFFWSLSLMAEVYTLHVFFMSVLIWLACLWQQEQRMRWLYAMALIFGLGLTNHLTTLLIVPGLAWWVLSIDAGWLRRPRHLLLLLTLIIVGLSPYLYLPLQGAINPPPVEAMHIQITGWSDVLNIVTGRVWWPLLFAYSLPDLIREARHALYNLWGNFLGVGLPLGILGCLIALRRMPKAGIALLLLYLSNAFFFTSYRVMDKAMMFLPTYLIWAIWIGIAYTWILDHMRRVLLPRWKAHAVTHIPFALMAALLLTVNYPLVDLSQDYRTYERADRIFRTVEEGAYVLAIRSWAEVAPLYFLHRVEKRRPDITILTAITPTDLDSLLADPTGPPVYSTAARPWLTSRYLLIYSRECDCYSVRSVTSLPP